MRVLLVEDDPDIQLYVAQGLREAGYAVDAMSDGFDALLAADAVDYDLAVLDIGLPKIDGLEVCRRLRARAGSNTAILFLTARDAVVDRVEGLDAGGDDYLVKPFAFAELLARLRSLLRRGGGDSPVLTVADLSLDPASHRVTRAGVDVRLTNKEFALLEYLMRNAGRVVTKTMIAEHVWDFDLGAETNFIEVYIYSVRKKLDSAGGANLIQTLRGAGYRLESPAPS
jgi:DNA-binding response OmpR family regulator